MKALKNAIETRGHFINDEVLKVDAFLNHQIDCSLVDEMGNEFYEHFKNKGITKVVTIESSGIAPSLCDSHSFECAIDFHQENTTKHNDRSCFCGSLLFHKE